MWARLIVGLVAVVVLFILGEWRVASLVVVGLLIALGIELWIRSRRTKR